MHHQNSLAILLSALLSIFLMTSAHADTSYVVRRGDTLLKISDRLLGAPNDPRRFDLAKQIRAKNPQLKNPNELEPGITLTLPSIPGKPSSPTPTPPPIPLTPPTPTPTPIPTPEPTPVPAPEPAPALVPDTTPTPTAAALPSPTPQPRAVATPSPDVWRAPQPPDHDDFLVITPRYNFVKIKTKNKADDSESEIISKESAGLTLSYERGLSETLHLLVDAGATYTDFGFFEPSTSTLDQSILWHKNFALGLGYEVTEHVQIEAKLKAADHTFLLPTFGTNAFVGQSLFIPSVEAAVSWEFLTARTFKLGLTVGAEYLTAVEKDGVNYEAAIDPIGTVYWNSDRGPERLNYRAGVTYDKRDQKTNLTEQEETNWLVSVGLIIPL